MIGDDPGLVEFMVRFPETIPYNQSRHWNGPRGDCTYCSGAMRSIKWPCVIYASARTAAEQLTGARLR